MPLDVQAKMAVQLADITRRLDAHRAEGVATVNDRRRALTVSRRRSWQLQQDITRPVVASLQHSETARGRPWVHAHGQAGAPQPRRVHVPTNKAANAIVLRAIAKVCYAASPERCHCKCQRHARSVRTAVLGSRHRRRSSAGGASSACAIAASCLTRNDHSDAETPSGV